MENFDWFTNVIVPSLLTFIFMVLAFMRNRIWFSFVRFSDRIIAIRMKGFHTFIRDVLKEEEKTGNIKLSRDSSNYAKENRVKFAKFQTRVENSKRIEFDDDISNWNANRNNQIKELYYYLNISNGERKKYTAL